MKTMLTQFGDDLELDDLNGALSKTGADFQFDATGATQPVAPAQPVAQPAQPVAQPAQPQATKTPEEPLPVPEWEKKKKKEGSNMGSILSLVGKFMGGGYGAALQGAGSLMGNKEEDE